MKAEQGSALIDMLYERPNGPWVMASSLQEILPHACIKAGIERDRGWRSYDGGGGGISATQGAERGGGGSAAREELAVAHYRALGFPCSHQCDNP